MAKGEGDPRPRNGEIPANSFSGGKFEGAQPKIKSVVTTSGAREPEAEPTMVLHEMASTPEGRDRQYLGAQLPPGARDENGKLIGGTEVTLSTGQKIIISNNILF